MPQLNPAPWFAILHFSWLIFLTVLLPTLLMHTSPNETTLQSMDYFQMEPWAWPWY